MARGPSGGRRERWQRVDWSHESGTVARRDSNKEDVT
jgi:hypothetical protein